MQHTTSGELYLVGNSLQHTATRKLHKEAPRTPYTATHCKYCDTSQHIAARKLQEVSLSLTREHIVGATLRNSTTTHYTRRVLQVNTSWAPHTTHCNTLQHTATHCNTLQGTILRHTTTHCNNLQHTATNCSTLQHIATHHNTLQYTANHCKALQQVSCAREHLEGTTFACE